MNQHLTVCQVNQLTDKQKENLRDQWTPKEGDYVAFGEQEEMIYYLNGVEKQKMLPLLTIGQMVEHLSRYDSSSLMMDFGSGTWQVSIRGILYQDKELCSALWEALKTIL